MSNVVLISPPEKHLLMEAGDRPNMGLLYLAGALRREGHRPMISDLNHDSYNDLNNKMKVADYVGITTFTPYFEWTTNFAKHLKQNFPDVGLIAGGPHASVDPKSLENYFDHIVIGEGEKAITGIVNGDTDATVVFYGEAFNLDSLPMPLTELEIGKYGMNQEGHDTITLMTSRSCDYHCSFCTKDILGSKQRFHSVDRVVEEIELAKKMGFNSIYFLDDNFTSNYDRAMNLTDKIKDLDVTYRVMSRTDKMVPELAQNLKESGARSVSFGLEHFDDNVLKMARKGETVETHLRGIKNAHDAGLKVRGSFIVNLPGATVSSAYKTLKMAMEERLEFADFYALVAYPGTQIWNKPEEFGCKVDKNYGFNQTSSISNVDNGNLGMHEVSHLITDIRNRWSKFKGLDCAWEAERYE